MTRAWPPIIARAAELVKEFEARFGRPPTLRRNHYELVSDPAAIEAGYSNTPGDYKRLSELTAKARRYDDFPNYSESVRSVSQAQFFDDAQELREHIREIARLDRMAGQKNAICVCVEKDGTRGFLHDWFDEYGVLVTSLNGYASWTLVDKLFRWHVNDDLMKGNNRELVVLYAGDHDASGEDIDRDFRERSGLDVRRVALLPEQVERYKLPRSPFEKDDSRAKAFVRRHGGLWQTELDALDPDILRELFMEAFDELWDKSAYEQRLADEAGLLADVLGDAA
jgi:hypothetical protein